MAAANSKTFCHECNMVIANAEERITDDSDEKNVKVFHKEPCARKYARTLRIRELFIRNAAEQGLQVVPHHPHGR